MSYLGDVEHKIRCNQLRKSLRMHNRAQGIGFVVFGVLIDKRGLLKIATSLVGAMGTLYTALFATL